jgi:hypothetical protein
MAVGRIAGAGLAERLPVVVPAALVTASGATLALLVAIPRPAGRGPGGGRATVPAG